MTRRPGTGSYSATAASWALGIAGVGQVLGRLGYARLVRRIGLRARTVAIFAVSVVTISDRWGTARYARLNGVFNAPLMIASALAPFLGAGLAAVLGGYSTAFAALAAFGLVAVFLAA